MAGPLFLIYPRSNQPRYHKREAAFRSLVPTKVAAFERSYYRDNFFAAGVDYLSLGDIDDGRYAARIPKFVMATRRLAQAATSGGKMYAFSLDCYLMGRLAGLKPGIIEVGDLRVADSRNPFARRLEKWVLNDCAALVVTSPAFLSQYYADLMPKQSRTYIIENKLDPKFAGRRRRIAHRRQSSLTIGVIGLLRYRSTLEMLVKAVRENPRLRLKCYGDGPDRDLLEASRGDRIEYFGPFQNPHDLERIYSSIDVSFSVYDPSSANVRLALPNKYYESVFFGVPLLAAKNTELGRRVTSEGLGGVLDTSDYATFARELAAITPGWIDARATACMAIPEADVIDDSQQVLVDILSDLGLR